MKTKAFPNAVLAVSLFLSACTTPQQDLTAKIVARRATIEILKSKPEYRPAFIASTVAIDLLLRKDGATRADFTAALQTLKIRELKGSEGALIITDILDLIDAALGDKPLFGDGLPRLKALLLSANDGMIDGLAFSALPP